MKKNRPNLVTEIKKYFLNNDGWHKKVDMFKVFQEWSPETVGRYLRKMSEQGEIKQGTYNGLYAKNLKTYANNGSLGQAPQPTEQYEIVELSDGSRVARKIYQN